MKFLSEHVDTNLHYATQCKEYELFNRCINESYLKKIREIPEYLDKDYLWSDPILVKMIPKSWKPSPFKTIELIEYGDFKRRHRTRQ